MLIPRSGLPGGDKSTRKKTESVASDTQCFEINYNQETRLCPDCSQATEQDPYSMEWWCHSCQKFETEEVMEKFKL